MGIVKGFLLILVLFSTTILGMKLSGKYKKRTEELKEMKKAITMLKTKMSYTYEPIPEIFEEITQKTPENIACIFKTANHYMKEEIACTSWEKALEENSNNMKKEDIKVLQGLGKLLGKTDLEGQISQIDLTLNFLETQIETAGKEQQKNEKMYRSLGIITGLALVIILI